MAKKVSKTARSMAKIRSRPGARKSSKTAVKKTAPKRAAPQKLTTAVRVKKASNPARRGVRAMGIQSRPDTIAKGKKAAPASSASGPGAMPRVGELAPDFVLPDCDGRAMQLSKLRGNPVVLYFYPKDDTPGCTIEAQEFSRDSAQFQRKGIVVIGVSKDDQRSHCAFRDKYGLKIPLLSDVDATVIRRYGCWGEKTLYGRKYMGTTRATFVIAADGHIMKVFPNVTPQGHSQEILKVFA